MQNMPIGIFRGDDTDAFSYQTIVGTINTDLDLTGCKAVFRYLSFSVEFDPIPEDRKLTIVIPADETKKFPPGLGYASLRVYDSEGRLKTFSNRIMVFVATKTPMFGSDEFEVDFSVRASLEPLKFFVGPDPDDFDEYRGYVEKVIDRASATKYGLAILLDAIDSDLGANDGVAATPVAVKAAYAAIIDKLTDDYYTAEETDEAIDRVAAYYITYDAAGNPFPTYAALANAQTVYSGGQVRTPTRNDYCVVLADETHDNAEYRYIYAVADGETTGSWQPQFPVEGVMTVDPTVTKNSQNLVASSGIWSAIWGALSALPTGFTSLYDWVVAQLGLKRDYTDLSYDMTETVEVPALHSVMTVGGQTLAEYDLLCTEEVPDPPQIGHTYTWRADGAAFYVTQGVSALQTTWILYSQNGESLDGVTTQNATQGFYPDLDFRPSGAVITIHKTTAQKTVTVEDELALKSGVPAPSTATPAMDGTGAAGTSAAFARGDHVHPTDTSRVPTSRKVNGKALSSDVTLTGADIWVSRSDPTKISAALAGKATKADATLTEHFSAWTLSGDVETGSQYEVRFDFDYDGTTLWALYEDESLLSTGSDDPLSISEDFSYGETYGEYTITATRTALQGYELGSQTDKPLASEAEAEALRTGKQDALSAQQLANIAAVSDALAFDATHTYAAGDPVVYNGTLYTFTATHTGAWTGSDVSAVDIIARLAGKLDKSGGTMTGPLTIVRSGDNIKIDGSTIRFNDEDGRATGGTISGTDGGGDVTLPTYSGTLALTAPNPTAGNLAALDANGNPTDSGIKASDKLDSTSAAPAFSTSSTYAVGDHVTYNGALYRCTTAVTTAGAWTGSTNWTAEDMTTPDATLDVTAPDKLLRLVATNGDVIWGQGYNLSTESSATVLTEQVGAFTFAADAVADQAIVLPSVAASKVGDFILDVTNLSANDRSLTLTGLDSAFSVVVRAGDDLSETLTVAAGEMARYYFTMTAFRVNSLPTWQVAKEAVENGGAQS